MGTSVFEVFHSVYDENWEGPFSHLYSSISCLVGSVACGLFGGLLLHRWRVDEGTAGLFATGDCLISLDNVLRVLVYSFA